MNDAEKGFLISSAPLATNVIERNTHVGDGKASRMLNGNAEMTENSGFEIGNG